VLSFLLVHKISVAFPSLNDLIVLLTTYISISLFEQDVDFYHNLPIQSGTDGDKRGTALKPTSQVLDTVYPTNKHGALYNVP
jgi:hypothetical protein